MKIASKISIMLILLFLWNYKSSGDATAFTVKDASIKGDGDNKLFVFVGEKVEITPIPYTPGDFDGGIKAKYKILQKVYGSYDQPEIEFKAFDHFGRFAFTKFEHVLLFVSEEDGQYYHEKYMYDDVYRTKDGRWAGCYSNDYNHEYNKGTKIKPIKIDFAQEVFYPVKTTNEDGTINTLSYPAPYFRTVGDKAIAVYGNYVEELFALKRDGFLTARGLFDRKGQ